MGRSHREALVRLHRLILQPPPALHRPRPPTPQPPTDASSFSFTCSPPFPLLSLAHVFFSLNSSPLPLVPLTSARSHPGKENGSGQYSIARLCDGREGAGCGLLEHNHSLLKRGVLPREREVGGGGTYRYILAVRLTQMALNSLSLSFSLVHTHTLPLSLPFRGRTRGAKSHEHPCA